MTTTSSRRWSDLPDCVPRSLQFTGTSCLPHRIKSWSAWMLRTMPGISRFTHPGQTSLDVTSLLFERKTTTIEASIASFVRDLVNHSARRSALVAGPNVFYLFLVSLVVSSVMWSDWDDVSGVMFLVFTVSYRPTVHSAIVEKLNESKGNTPRFPRPWSRWGMCGLARGGGQNPERERREGGGEETDRQTDRQMRAKTC